MRVDYKLLSRDHKKSVSVEDAIVDPRLEHTIAPLHWLEALRSPSSGLPRGYFEETDVTIVPPPGIDLTGPLAENGDGEAKAVSAIRAGPLVMYIVGQTTPVVLHIDFVREDQWPGMNSSDDCDIRVGMDAICQCQLYTELFPGGLLSSKSTSELRKQGMICDVAESPLVSRPHLRMKNMFVDELTRGAPLQEFVGYNPRVGQQWRFSQHCKLFRQGIWRELTRKNDLHGGNHNHSSWQKSPQQSVPEVRFMAPSP